MARLAGPQRCVAVQGGITATIPPRAHRRRPAAYDATSYKGWHLMENSFMDTKQFRAVVTRCAKLVLMFEGPLHRVAWIVGTRAPRRGASPHLTPTSAGAPG